MKRDTAEKDLVFLGLLIMENKLKPVTSSIITQLNECKIRTIMATGDNILTAISVSRQCNIIGADQNVYYSVIENDHLYWRSSNRNMTIK